MLSKRHTGHLNDYISLCHEDDPTKTNVHQEVKQKETCYICYQPENKNHALMASPCGQCKLKVHQSCFEQLQMYEHNNHRCVILDIGNSNQSDHYIVYTTCGVCKHRFEYTSRTLIDKLAEQLLSNAESVNESEPESTTTDALLAHQICQTIHTTLSYIPESARSHVWTILQKTLATMANTTSLEDYISYLQHSIRICSMSIYFTSFCVGLTGLFCLNQSFSHYILQIM